MEVCVQIFVHLCLFMFQLLQTFASTCMFACVCTHMPACSPTFWCDCVCVSRRLCAFDEPSLLKRGCAAVMQ